MPANEQHRLEAMMFGLPGSSEGDGGGEGSGGEGAGEGGDEGGDSDSGQGAPLSRLGPSKDGSHSGGREYLK